MSTDIKTIHEFLADNPNVDVSKAWDQCWKSLSHVTSQIRDRFEVQVHPSCADREYYTSVNEEWEGSFQSFTGPKMDWLVHSWLGSRSNSILDMNATAFLGQDTRVPHMVIVYGTIPNLFFYCDYTPRSNLMIDTDYLDKYYGPDVNESFLELRGNSNFSWSVSHGTYMRSLLSPVALSLTAELTPANISTLEAYVNQFVSRWLGWLDDAEPVPEKERAALQKYDYKVRELGYRLDPMNSLAANVFGEDQVEGMIEMRMGREQMNATKKW